MRAGPLLRSVVRFQPLNLQSLDVSGLGPFDLIFCRNALIYFEAGTAEHVVQGLLRHLSAEGLLLLGHAETLRGMACRMRGVHPSVYVRDPVREER
jgi:chemotaxis protein methyltransferase CheR